jgi:acetyl esterase/lipase
VRAHAKRLGIDPKRIASGGAPQEDLAATYNEQFKTRLSDCVRGPIEKVSPFHYAKEKPPPCIMFFGTDDPLLLGAEVPRNASTAARNQCNIITYRGQGRGFFNLTREAGNYYKLAVAEMDKVLVSLGWLKTRSLKG